ncbi:DNA gyrase inhibitor YacG [Siccirubricoccus sp. G192]|uniref:DNA gyrase inhibitor YacG n=1 Tax=Siccirubricoccus sp. G192 TaxID=2849651 RepID=UPI001C2C29E5|nr:DNA gyrase inhibitor YacG [Siccirubricoccus sp. G192]MBV1797552.1 DNA gyrase inhibitor YacG [Siccirubricoccus sp. G192]
MADEPQPPAPTRPRPARPCAICGKPAVAAFRPFCSARCRQVDLGRWLAGDYAIPAEPEPARDQEEDV